MARAVAPRVTKVPEIRKGDTILVLGGKDAGKRVRACTHCGQALEVKS